MDLRRQQWLKLHARGRRRGVIAPGRSVVSTYNTAGASYIGAPYYCGAVAGYDEGPTGDAFGTCTGTSMAAPHVTALAGIMRSASPLTSQDTIQALIRGASRDPYGGQSQSDEFGYGMPKAGLALEALIPAGNPQNRLTPLFSFYSSGREDYFYTTVPQMGRAARYGTLQPQPNVPVNYAYSDTLGYGSYPYASVGNLLNIYSNFPGTPYYWAVGAQVWLFTTPENPKDANVALVPLFRLSFACNHPQYSNASSPTACAANPNHTDTTYSTEIAGVDAYVSVGYRLDGVEGYVYSKSAPQPAGTVRLMRKYHPGRDDHAIFPETELTNMFNQGYTDNSGSDWLGYVYPNTNGAVPTIQ